METSIRTIFGSYLQTVQYLKRPVVIPQYTTLNEKFNIHASETLNTNEIPSVAYVGIGNGGHKAEIGADGFSKVAPVGHSPKHAALYNQLPFVLRTTDNDLTTQQRNRYRLRRVETHNGITYFAYYLRKLDLTSTIPQMSYVSVTENGTIVQPFVPSIEDLNNPQPPQLSNGDVNLGTGDYLSVTAQILFSMDSGDLEEFSNVISVKYDDMGYGIISELAICSGVDRQLPGTIDGMTQTYTDAVAVQVCNFLNRFYSLQSNPTSIDILLDIGATESLLMTAP